MPVGAGELGKRVLYSLGGGGQTDVVDRQDNVRLLYDNSTLYSYRPLLTPTGRGHEYPESESSYFHCTRFTTRQKLVS
ncbi:hypothetical protein PISMIDRAFT_542171 [Pisolithus microcarpus 441]|uniref:Uncharacterized protein n=1 Tax=Pisolithus microcarpus 441 TaxID=765257 RepID=A0A0C9XF87_9AGAM|nr:hypothetical protein PISMIDRAFT_542171 [Pisolithus microcarpus 441]